MIPFTFGVFSCILTLLAFAQLHDPICKVVLDGRVSKTATLQTFDNRGSPFHTDHVKGHNLQFSQILKFPPVAPSMFELKDGKPIEITINDNSIYQQQTGARRAGLILAGNNGMDDATNDGVKTFHWSVHQPLGGKPLNLTHEYLNAWHQSNYKAFHFRFEIGTLIKREWEVPFTYWKILNRSNKIVYSTLVDFKEWQNFAVTLDFDKDTLRVYYSKGYDQLKPVTNVLANDNGGKGRFQVGIFKKPTDAKSDLTGGFQETGFEESQIYGGIFVENSAHGCVSR